MDVSDLEDTKWFREYPGDFVTLGSLLLRYKGSDPVVSVPEGSIDIPNEVSLIEAAAFEDCTSLRSVTLPDCAVELQDDIFAGCTALEEILKRRKKR